MCIINGQGPAGVEIFFLSKPKEGTEIFHSEKIRKNSEKLRKIRKNSEKFRKIQKNLENFGTIWKNSEKFGKK